ncbi:MAG: DUF2169 domain-containing protein [Myxococcota bacterium]
MGMMSASLAPAAAAPMSWQIGERRFVGIVVKGAFSLVADGRMTVRTAPPVEYVGRFERNSPARPLRYPSDVVPYRTRADLLVNAQLGARDEKIDVAVGLLTPEGKALMYKRLVVGAGGPVTLSGSATFSGDDNPHGVSRPEEATVSYASGGPAPAFLNPLTPYARSRRGHSGAKRAGRFGAEVKKGETPELPPDVDWSVFQASSPDQQVPFLRGHEWLLLRNLHPAHQELRCQLPVEQGYAFVAAPSGAVAPPLGATWTQLNLVADLLAVDPGRFAAVITWRGYVEVDPATDLDALRFVSGVASHPPRADDLPSPASIEREVTAHAPSHHEDAPMDAVDVTLTLDGAVARSLSSPYVIPEASGATTEGPIIPGAPWGPRAPVVHPPTGPSKTTLLQERAAPPASASPPSSQPVPRDPPAPEPPPVAAEVPGPSPRVIKAEGWKQNATASPSRRRDRPPQSSPPPRPAVVDLQSLVYGRFS